MDRKVLCLSNQLTGQLLSIENQNTSISQILIYEYII